MTVLVLVVGGAVVVLALAVTLALTLRRLHAQQQRAQAGADALAAHNQIEHDRRLKSLEMITLATLAGDCELSEGCLRVRALLQFYPGLRAEPEFEPIERLYTAIRHFDVGDARRDQSPDVLARQDRERHEIEGRHRSAVLACFRVLRERVEELRGSPFDVDVARGSD